MWKKMSLDFYLLIFATLLFTSAKGQDEEIIEKPNISLKCINYTDYNSPCAQEFQDENQTVVASLKQYQLFSCTAKYLIKVEAGIAQSDKYGLEITRNVKDVYDFSTYSMQVDFYFDTSERSSGTVTCRSVENPQIFSSRQYFTPASKFFTNSGETLSLNLPKEDSPIIPCPSNYANVDAILEHRNSNQEAYRQRKWPYEPKVGFLAGKNPMLKGEFKCVSPLSNEDFVIIKFIQKEGEEEKKAGENIVLEFGVGSTALECWDNDDGNLTSLVDTRCKFPEECELIGKCMKENNCKLQSIGEPCTVPSCLSVEHAQPVGIAVCKAGSVSLLDHHFLGLDRKYYFLSKGNFPERALIYVNEVDPILYTDTTLDFYCQALQFFFTHYLQFSVVYRNGSKSALPSGMFKLDGYSELSSSETFGVIQARVHLNLTADMTEIICHAPWYNSSREWYTKSRKFTALDVKAPEISRSHREHVFYIGEHERTLSCKTDTRPSPMFKWFANGTEIGTTNVLGFTIVNSELESVLRFPEIHDDIQGLYECRASNRVGNDSATFRVDVRASRISGLTIGLLALLLAVITSILGAVFCRMRHKYLDAKEKLRNLTEEEIQQFEKGVPEMIATTDTAEANVVENAQFLPFNDTYKLLDEDVIIDKSSVLGQGQFGLVVRGKYLGDPVAVKTTLPSADVSYFKALLSELKVMAYIGNHPNVVRFIGAITNRIRERIVYIIVELSPMGNLESYLKSHRTTYVNFVVNDQIVKTELSYTNIIKRVTTLDFVNWCHQIAAGMEYLSNKKVIHGDLAVRNILLFHGDVAKITDFGLSRQLYENTNYTKKNQAPLPWRWMAIESLRDLEFSTKSDVWAYAVTAWEVFTMAEVPYPGLTWSQDFIDQLEGGLRMRKPKFATVEIYGQMTKCWDPDPDQRPTFTQLREFFEHLLADFNGGSVSINIERAMYSNYCA